MNRYTIPIVLACIWSLVLTLGPIFVPGDHSISTAPPICFCVCLVGLAIVQVLGRILVAVSPPVTAPKAAAVDSGPARDWGLPGAPLIAAPAEPKAAPPKPATAPAPLPASRAVTTADPRLKPNGGNAAIELEQWDVQPRKRKGGG